MECESDLSLCKVVRLTLFGVAAAVLFVLGFAACSSDGDEGTVNESTVDVARDGSEISLSGTTTSTTTTTGSPSETSEEVPTTTTGSVDEKAGLELIVDDFLAGMWPRRGLRENHVYIDEQNLASEDPAIRLRGEFERSVFIELGINSSVNDPYYVQLFNVGSESYVTCFLEELGYKPEEELSGKFSAERQQELFDELGWDEQQVIAVENRCWNEALEFRGLGEGETERLLDLQREYYLDIAREWAATNPDRVVPLPTTKE